MPDHLTLDRLSTLWRLVADDVRTPEHIRNAVVDSVFHWWETSSDPAVLDELTEALGSLSACAAAGLVAARLRHLAKSDDPKVIERVIGLLSRLPTQAGASVPLLTELIRHGEGPIRWSAAKHAAQLGLDDGWIIAHLSERETVGQTTSSRITAPGRFNREHFRILYSQSTKPATNAERGNTLEALAECLFLGVPGIDSLSRNLRTLSDEIDLAFVNRADGFWREVGDPFIVECKNRTKAVSASMVRDFAMKLQTHGLRGAFIVTTTRLTADARVEIRQTHRDGRFITAVEKKHLASIAADGEPHAILHDCFYSYRLL